MAHRVFAYGILKRGDGIDAVTADSHYSLFGLGGFPGAHKQGNMRIKGKLLFVDDATLAQFDRIEGHPRFYCREQINIDGYEEPAWMYIYQGQNSGRQDRVEITEDGIAEWQL